MKTMICTCEHKYQDKKLGVSKRYYNETVKGWRCTVCGKTVEEYREKRVDKK